MTQGDDSTAQMERDGWSVFDDGGYLDLVGPLWHRTGPQGDEYAIVGAEKHRNRRGVVQGGLLMTLADRSCGMVARASAGVATVATVQMDTQFIDAGYFGDILISRPAMIRATRSLIFMTTDITAGDRVLIRASGIFKVMRS